MKKHQDYLRLQKSFALIPIKTADKGWVWLKRLWVVNDHRPVEYLGLLTVKKYFLEEKEARDHYNELSEII